MNLAGRSLDFRRKRPQSNPYRVFALLGMLILSVFLLRAVEENEITPPFMPTLIPTRVSASFALEGETHFITGDLNAAIKAYQEAVNLEPNNPLHWSDLARIQTYSSTMLTTDADRKKRLQEALDSIDIAVKISPDDSTVHAVRAFVLDWYASPALAGEEWQNMLNEAEQEAVRALQLDNQNTLALVYYSEILVDQKKWIQAEQYIRQAIARDPTSMDVHRVFAYVQESIGNYKDAIDSYLEAAKITPNLTFLYLSVGANYRILRIYDLALEYFDKAARINEQLGIKDPIPYLAIGRTYSQMGEFFVASRNVLKALNFQPTNPDVFAQLGIVYFKSRNYEGAIPAFQCALLGCNTQQSCDVRQCDSTVDVMSEIQGMPLSDSTLVYYYTYGSVLAGMHSPGSTYCNEAVKILKLVSDSYGNDKTVSNIVDSSLQICASYNIYP